MLGKPKIIPVKQANFQSPPPIPFGYFKNIIKGRAKEPIPEKVELIRGAKTPESPGNVFGVESTFQKGDINIPIKLEGIINLLGIILCSRSIAEITINI